MAVTELKPFPAPIPLKKILGPSFIILALGLGSGEVILWPYLSANFGLGIAWGAFLGITFQYFINMEIERYALIKGESVFVGLNKIFSWTAYWFIISTFIGFGLPGIVAASAEVFAYIFGLASFKWVAIIFLVAIGLIISLGKTVYEMMEGITKTIIFLGIPFIVVLAIILSHNTDWLALGQGLIGIGDNYYFLPAGISLATFLAAFAYSGAGGNLNLTQSIYIKEKGYGMGKYSQKISGLFKNLKEKQHIELAGQNFELNESNIKNFKAWWRKINIEHLAVFWFIGLVGISVLMILAFSTAFGLANNSQGINFVINEGVIIGQKILPWVGTLFLLVVAVMLFQTQLGILDSTSRIMAENAALKKIAKTGKKEINLSKIYFLFLWAQIGFGVILFLLNFYEPKSLIILGAVINAVAMFVHIGLVNVMNYKLLPKALQPGLLRRLVIIFIFLFFGGFSAITIWDSILSKIF
ncbi:MAG: hypothetical protein A3A24_01100 [Candidatus Buchananbacteria bacterium RIFCSPLOWO2_01_FULL_46_12]|uniref:Uncharacterized protein n=2 Tax=Candidatus Buchananiibacteriota TaxID=1817903 RepID=A0A1G1YRW2_9BACT|nr:MAG: hypothetical protein A2744_00320 [Candidatus Buchananbacteria bacterium RIFCSPHIGHO2_01_FULL_44_11]OGY55061.1 MAG: hypothetical protein A3A24_01100 [Candidatus Buchananbacteria bacterium RIFCSPLOWO2_01_FULL_46_12]